MHNAHAVLFRYNKQNEKFLLLPRPNPSKNLTRSPFVAEIADRTTYDA